MQICGFCKKEIDRKDFRKGLGLNRDTAQRVSAGTYMFSCPHCHAILGFGMI